MLSNLTIGQFNQQIEHQTAGELGRKIESKYSEPILLDYNQIVSEQVDSLPRINASELFRQNQTNLEKLKQQRHELFNGAPPPFFQLTWDDISSTIDPETGEKVYEVESGKYDEEGNLNPEHDLLDQVPLPPDATIVVHSPNGTTAVYKTDSLGCVKSEIKNASSESGTIENDIPSTEGLTDTERQKIKEETGWSDEIINHIDSWEQYEKVYKNAGLHEANINGRPCLVKDIDWDYRNPKDGKTNRELVAEGKAPYDSKTGERIELHHMGQDKNSPFAELTENTEHGDGNHSVLHPSEGESWRHEPGAMAQYNQERVEHWKARAEGAN